MGRIFKIGKGADGSPAVMSITEQGMKTLSPLQRTFRDTATGNTSEHSPSGLFAVGANHGPSVEP